MNKHIEAKSVTGLYDLRGNEIKVFIVCEPPRVLAITSFSDVTHANYLWRELVTKASWYDPDKEMCVVFCLDQQLEVKAWNLVSMGSATCALAHPREVLRPVIASAATGFVLMHNHPGGDPSPSVADIAVTDQLRRAADCIDVRFVDHIIIGRADRDPHGLGLFSFEAERRRKREEHEERQRAEWAARKETRKQARLEKQKAREATAA